MNIHLPNLARLSDALRHGYATSAPGEKTTAIHLFGVVHAEELAGLSRAELERLALDAGLTPSFATELRKMVKLARYVEPRREADATGSTHGKPEAHRVVDGLSTTFARLARPLPPGYKFDREEANRR